MDRQANRYSIQATGYTYVCFLVRDTTYATMICRILTNTIFKEFDFGNGSVTTASNGSDHGNWDLYYHD